MNYSVPTYGLNVMVKIPVRTNTPTRIRIKAKHPYKPYTYYTDRWNTVHGVKYFYIKIPKAPKEVIFEIYNEKHGNTQFDSTFQVGKFYLLPNNPIVFSKSFENPTVRSFIDFTEDFAENAGVLSAQNSVYVSPDGKFRVNYVDEIRDDAGRVLKTPAQINGKTGIIKIAAKYFRNYTVPGRKGTMYHEFSHLWRNRKPSDEIEADKNGLMLYLGTGNPNVDAFNTWLGIFYNNPTDANVERTKELTYFINNFNNIMDKKINR